MDSVARSEETRVRMFVDVTYRLFVCDDGSALTAFYENRRRIAQHLSALYRRLERARKDCSDARARGYPERTRHVLRNFHREVMVTFDDLYEKFSLLYRLRGPKKSVGILDNRRMYRSTLLLKAVEAAAKINPSFP